MTTRVCVVPRWRVTLAQHVVAGITVTHRRFLAISDERGEAGERQAGEARRRRHRRTVEDVLTASCASRPCCAMDAEGVEADSGEAEHSRQPATRRGRGGRSDRRDDRAAPSKRRRDRRQAHRQQHRGILDRRRENAADRLRATVPASPTAS